MSEQSVVIGPVRVVYPSFTSPTKWKDQKTGADKFTGRFLIEKSDAATMKTLAAMVMGSERAKALYGDALRFSDGSGMPKHFIIGIGHDADNQPFKDGDDVDQPDHRGHFYINANSLTAPRMIDGNMQKILDPSVIYSGCYVNVAVAVKVYNFSGNKGISWFLNDIQFVRGGPEIATGPSLDNMFGKVENAEAVGGPATDSDPFAPEEARPTAAPEAQPASDPFG